MPLTTRFPAAQDGLKTLIAARPALAGVQLILGDPLKELRRETIWIEGIVENWQRQPATSARDDLVAEEESFDLTVHVFALVTGAGYTAARNRAITLAGEVDLAIRSDRSLGGAVERNTFITGGEVGEGPLGQARVVEIALLVSCEAYLRT